MFEDKIQRIFEVIGSDSDSALARALGIQPPSVAGARKRKLIPGQWIEKIALDYNICADWLLFGRGPMRPEAPVQEDKVAELRKKTDELLKRTDDEIIMIPMVEAVLSAGGGSFETCSMTGRGYAFRRDFILRKGKPKDMVLMRVAGDSMEPEILSGDVVLIDQGKTRIVPGHMFAVGFEEAIYLKRIDIIPGKAILKSANPAYPPMELDIRGQLSDQFRVIGRVLWSGREYK